ncbi:flavin reductase family protein [Thalassolituus sp. LLYu03]|uniref:flavin reductase family protein n=1 Tax=Thalassolituus sp. LLYu03 TaxID=3421656 RepID=UPI003D29618D
MTQKNTPIDAQTYRSVMGLWPTGVSVVTGTGQESRPLGLVIGSFTSVSLDPPLVAFCPQKSSSSWTQMAANRHLCINFLGVHQSAMCWRFASGDIHTRFDGLSIKLNPEGAVRLPGCCAWLDVEVEHEIDGGDHWIVLCRVIRMDRGETDSPLAFVKGRLCSSSPVVELAEDHLQAWENSINQIQSL